MLGSKAQSGYCVYGVASYLYQSFYPPLLYLTFLAEFFLDDGMDLDLVWRGPLRYASHPASRVSVPESSASPRALALALLPQMYYSEMKDAGYFDEYAEDMY